MRGRDEVPAQRARAPAQARGPAGNPIPRPAAHGCDVTLLGSGIHPKIVSEIGHSQIAITLDIYSHVTPTMQREATAAMQAIFTR